MMSTSNFELCLSSSEKLWMHAGICVPLTLVLKAVLRRDNSSPLTGKNGIPFRLLTPIAIVIGTVALVYEESFERGSLLNCGPFLPAGFTLNALAKMTMVISHIFFMFRVLAFQDVYSQVEVVCAIINIIHFAQDVIALWTHQHLVAFQYLFFYNFFCPEVKEFFSKWMNVVPPKCKNMMKFAAQLCLVTLLLAGSLRVAEEWHTNENFHPDSDEPLTLMKSNWSYVYWIIVSISTVGYWDLTPSTPVGQFMFVVAIVIFPVWFNNITSSLYGHLEESQETQ